MVILVAFLWFFQAKAASKPTSKAAAKPSSKASAKPVSKASAKPASRAGSKKPASKVNDLLFILVSTTYITISSHAFVTG